MDNSSDKLPRPQPLNSHIYVCHHQPGSYFEDACFRPIQVGAATNADHDLGLLRDDTGTHISDKNPTFCELTALYWAWKNDTDADWIGLMHYRRFLDFTGADHRPDTHGCVNVNHVDASTFDRFGLNAATVQPLIASQPDIQAILPKKWHVKNAGYKNLAQQYAHAPHHFEKDLALLRTVLEACYPESIQHYDAVMNSAEGYFTNLFVLRKPLFDAYCEWLFTILFEVEKRLDMTNYSRAAKRVLGYLSERLFNVFIAQQNLVSPLNVIELERIFIQSKKEKINHPPKRCTQNAVSIVTAADNQFVPHVAAFMASVQDNLDKNRPLDLIVLDGGIPLEERRLLERQFHAHGPGRLTFLSCADYFTDIPLHAHFSAATFYRLSLGELLRNHERVIYLDADTIVLGDLAELYDMDLGDNVIGAVPDIIMRSFVARGVPALREAGGAPAGRYLKEWVGLGNRVNDYFQAGLILIDLDRYRTTRLREAAYADLKSKRYWFLDQDVLNKHLLGQVKFLDLSWNVVNVSIDIINGLEQDLAAKVREVFAAPRIVHYAGHKAKPWHCAHAPLAHFYWYYLRQTFWYEAVTLHRSSFSSTLDAELKRSLFYRGARAIWRRLPNTAQQRLFWLRDKIIQFAV
jgi:lipopolysaccharide biosynthesis glycosyltransferase